MSAFEGVGETLRTARIEAGLSLSRMAELTHFSKPYLGQVETGRRTATIEIVDAYERVLGADMRRNEITHPGLTRIKGTQRLSALVGSVRSGIPDVFAERPTSHATDVAVGTRLDPDGVRQFLRWMTEGETATLRTNSLSVIAKLPGKENAQRVVQVLEEDAVVRRLCLASDISRLTQVDWRTALRVADDLPSHPNPTKLARKAAKEAVDPKDTESRWCGAYMLRRLAPVVGR